MKHRETTLKIFNELEGKEFILDTYLFLITYVKWSLKENWLTFDIRLLPQSPKNQILLDNINWMLITRVLNLDTLTLVDWGGSLLSGVEARMWVTFR